jgi:hypothetical protein
MPRRLQETPDFAHELGLNPDQSFDVEELRNAMRFDPDGQSIPQVLISLTQTVTILAEGQQFEFPGGSSLIIDLTVPAVGYCVSKSVDNASTRKGTSEFLAEAGKDRCGRSSLYLIPAVPSRHYTSSHERFNVLRRSKLIKPVAQLQAEDGGRRIGAPWRQLHLIRSKPRVQT